MNEKVKQIECEEAIKMLLEYLDHELDHHNHKALENHLHKCRSCFTRMEFEKRLKSIVVDAKEEHASDKLRNRIKKLTENY
jgi:anti-sigma factor (TIGR02949 family)